MSDIDPKNEPIDIVLNQNAQTTHEHFTINSVKASEILGVNRTRLSQLTTQGIFPYERRKIDTRSRLFYRLNDLLNYQRKSSFGNLPHSDSAVKIDTTIPLLPAHSAEYENDKTPGHSKSSLAFKSAPSFKMSQIFLNETPSQKAYKLETALNLKNIQNEREKLESLQKTVEVLKEQMTRIVNFVTTLESQISQTHTKKLNAKKSVFRRARPQHIFKRIKK